MDPQNTNNQQPSQEVMQALQFVDEIIDQKHLFSKDQITPEARDEMRREILMKLDEFVMNRVISKLSDQELVEFENLIKEGKSQAEIQQFITTHVPDFVNFATQAFLDFRNSYLEGK